MFAERGYHATGISDLTEAVGLGKGAFYYHIGSKEELLHEIVARHVEQMVAKAEEIAARTDLSPPDKVRMLSRELMRTIAENLPELTVFFHEIPTLTSGTRGRELVKLRDRFEALWAQILQEGVDAKVFRKLDPIALKGLLGMHNYSYIWIRPQGRLSPEEVSDTFCDIVLAGMLLPEK
jgi:AcrR family transcriptional regulator